MDNRRTSAAIPRLAALFKQADFDVLFAASDGPGRAAVIAKTLSRASVALVIVSQVHYSTQSLSHRWLRNRLVSLLYAKADIVAGPSPGVVSDLESAFPKLAGRTRVLPNPWIPRAAVPTSAARSEKRFLSVGNLIRRKGHDIALKALSIVVSRHPELTLHLAGRADDPSYLNELKKYVHQNGLQDNVEFLGFVPDPLPLMATSLALVHAARSEAFGIVIAEAMRLGTPVIATDCPGGPGWILEGGQSGLLVPPEDPIGLAEAMSLVYTSDDMRITLKERGKLRANQFTPSSVARQYLELADEIAV